MAAWQVGMTPEECWAQGSLVGHCLGTTQLDTGSWLVRGLRAPGHRASLTELCVLASNVLSFWKPAEEMAEEMII